MTSQVLSEEELILEVSLAKVQRGGPCIYLIDTEGRVSVKKGLKRK